MCTKKCLCWFTALLLGAFSTGFSASVTLSTLDEQFSSEIMTVLRFKLQNNSQDTIQDFELHYHVVQDTVKIAPPEIYYMPTGMANWVFHNDTSATLVIYFPELIWLPGETLGGESGFSIGMHNADWSPWSKWNDPSQPASPSFSVANNIDVIAGGKTLMQGHTKYQNCPVVQFVEVQSDTIALQVLQLLNTDTPNIAIKGPGGDLATIHLNHATTDSLGQTIWRGFVPVAQDSNRGEFWAQCDGNQLAYFAYGWIPQAATHAVNNKLWDSSHAFVQANFDMGYNQGLRANERLVLRTDSLGKFLDARNTAHWTFYRAWEEPGEPTIPGILYPDFGAAYEPAEDMDSLTFEWTPLEGIEWYHFLVMKDSIGGDTLISQVIEGAGIKTPIFAEAGNYVWYAEPLVEAGEGEAFDFLQPSSDTPTLLRRSWFKRLKRCTKKTVKKATQVYTPVIHSFAYDEPLWKSIKTSVKKSLNPIGIIKILAPTITQHTKKITIHKNLTYLDLSYQYLAYPFKARNGWNECPDKNHFCASKDTRILQTDWNTKYNVNSKTWDKVVFKPEEGKKSTASSRCWLTMAQALNHYYGGSIPQDQIMYHVRKRFTNHQGGGPVETMQAVNYALGMSTLDATGFTLAAQAYKAGSSLPSILGWSILSPHPATIILNIEQGKPLGVSQLKGGEGGAHSMLLDGYKIQANGNMHVHVLNTDNLGSSEWRYYCNLNFLGLDVLGELIKEGFVHLVNAISGKHFDTDDIFFSYFTPPTSVSARATDTRFFTDTDGDGMVDFDEAKRFGTSPTSADTDGDGIDDKTEVFDYAQCQFFTKLDNLADRDGDGLDAQLDTDSDGDGYCDFQEAGYLFHNASSCNRFDPSRYPLEQEPLCRSFKVAWLASDKIYVNDRAVCTDPKGALCPVASFQDPSVQGYGVQMGVSAQLGSIYSVNSVLMRHHALVTGSVETGGALVKQSSTATVQGSVNQHSSMVLPLKNYYASLLMDGGSPIFDFTENSRATLNANETKSILDLGATTEGLHLTVNSGAHLKLVPGSYALSSFSVNSGAVLEMPATGLVELYIGKDFQWKGAFNSSNLANIAQRLKIYYVGTNTAHLDANFAAKVVAPHAKVILGQSGKEFYGSIYAKSIVIHQNTKFTWVPYKD